LRPDDRSRYIAAHGILRQLLGRYLSIAPAELAFGQNAFGKPLLTAGTGRTAVSFNLAHSGDLILYAFASDYRVGIDVEAINTDLDVTELAQSQFSLHEIQTLQAMMPSERTSAFFRCWTRKEAYLKARGEGLVFPLGQFSVSFAADVPPGIRWAADDPTVAARWSMFDLTPAPGYAGAIVVEHPSIHLVSRPWGPFAE
jgi:4'-phosphopantetheinyl transferase